MITTFLCIVAIGGGFGLIVAADYYDWLPDSLANKVSSTTSNICNHDIPAERCPFCNPELVESLGWCNAHAVPEALCTRCNSVLNAAFKAKGDWCAEHGLPESQCLLCGAETQPGVLANSEQYSTPANSTDRTRPEVMRANREPSVTCTTQYTPVQLKSADVARWADLKVVPIQVTRLDETVTCNAEVAFDGGRYARLASRASGVVTEVRVDLGATVAKGEILALIDSAELGSAKAAYLQARSLVGLWEKNYAREQILYEKRVGTEEDALEAETRFVESQVLFRSAQQRLNNLGLSDKDVLQFADDDDTSSFLPLRAPFDGVIIARDAVAGEVVSTSQSLFEVADTTDMWIMLDLYENDVMHVAIGQTVLVTIDAMPTRAFEGTLTWISSHVDRRTRTIQARAEFKNPDGLLRANMFGSAEIRVQTIESAVLVPESAVQWDGCCNVVFVRHTDTVYQPYKVTLGYKRDGYYVVEEGLPAGELVVTQGSFLLKTEILKGNIGAGCCEVDPGSDQ